ncbi:MAG: protein NO VEIN domain-containing protein [Chitinophagales bacterium]
MSIYELAFGKIGIKKLKKGDLGLADNNLTHIGLYFSTLSHLPHEKKTYPSQLIYKNKSYEGFLFLKFINNNRSPAINVGTKTEQKNLPHNIVSIGKKIRNIANTNTNIDWYLIWFALDNKEIITILLNQNSNELSQLSRLGINLNQLANGRLKIGEQDTHYNTIAKFVNQLTTKANLEYIEELEVASQIGERKTSKRKIPRPKDFARINKLLKEIGKTGEELLYQYFSTQKKESKIKNFKWLNKSREMFEPFDFEIIRNDNTLIFSDAKSTNHPFEKHNPIYLSTEELTFIHDNKGKYLIHRLYSINSTPKLKICDNIHLISDIFLPNYELLNTSLNKQGLLAKGLKLAVPTNLEILNFGNEIVL